MRPCVLERSDPRVVIIGGGFAGLNAARLLGRAGISVTLVDRNNYHLFQPLLYQVATGSLAPGDIAAPLRSVVARYGSVTVIRDEATDLDAERRVLITKNGRYPYDFLIIATGVTHSYFAHDDWETKAPGLKTIEDAVAIRSRVLQAFEEAEQIDDLKLRQTCLSFVVVGGGPTGVELSGALAELAKGTLRGEFRNFKPEDVQITLVEGGPRVLHSFHERTSHYVAKTLSKLGVSVRTEAKVVSIGEGFVEVEEKGARTRLQARTVLWAAGVKASPLSAVLTKRAGGQLDQLGRVTVLSDLSLPGHAEIFVLGDLANVVGLDGAPLPGVAPVAIQQGRYIAAALVRRGSGKKVKPFRYLDKGNMAVIGRGRAVAETWKLRLSGFPAWVAWALIHIYYLIEFENKIIVFFHWAWNYATNKRGSRLITRLP